MACETVSKPQAAAARSREVGRLSRMDRSDCDALLTLMLTPGLGHGLIGRCIEAMGSAQAVIEADATTLGQVRGISRDGAATIRRGLTSLMNDGEVAREKQLMA